MAAYDDFRLLHADIDHVRIEGNARAGHLEFDGNQGTDRLYLSEYLKRYGGTNEWIQIVGPSMEGKGLYSGDLVVVSSGAPLAFGKLVVVRVGDHYPLVKLYTSRGLWSCYADRRVKEVLDEEAVITGVVIYHLRDLSETR